MVSSLGGLLQISSRAAVWRRHAYTLCSSTRCSQVGILYVRLSLKNNECEQGIRHCFFSALFISLLYPGNQDEDSDSKGSEPVCVFCFFSLPNAGFMYSLKNTVELISTYQYPEKAHQAALCDQFLYVITR